MPINTPWNLNFELFRRVKNDNSELSGKMNYKTCEVLPNDPESQFILKYFMQNKPPGYSPKRIICIHNSDMTRAFETELDRIEKKTLVEKPLWPTEPFSREKVIHRWKTMTNQFSPLEITIYNSSE